MKKQKAQQNAPLVFEFSYNDKIPTGFRLRKNIGYAALSKIQLGVHTFLANRQRHTNEKYDANAIMKMLVFQRLLAPASKKKAFESKDYLFENCDFSLDNVYRGLAFMNGRRDAMQLWMHQRVQKQYGREWMGDDYKWKSRKESREIHLHTADGSKMGKMVDEKHVVFYSAKYDKRAKAERALAVAKAQDIIASPGKYRRATSYGAAGYVKNLKFDKKTGEVLDVGAALLLDWDKIREAEVFDGYYIIATSEMEESDSWVIDSYRGLWRIENSFRVIKDEFDARPVYVSTPDHIDAHFLVCFVALVVARLLEMMVNRKYSIGKMLETLENAECTYLQQNYYLFDYTDEILDELGAFFGIDFSKRTRGLGEIKNIFWLPLKSEPIHHESLTNKMSVTAYHFRLSRSFLLQNSGYMATSTGCAPHGG